LIFLCAAALGAQDGAVLIEEGILYAEVDASVARAARQEFDPVGHYSRPDVFRLSIDTSARPPTA